jgi:hypothetical protein
MYPSSDIDIDSDAKFAYRVGTLEDFNLYSRLLQEQRSKTSTSIPACCRNRVVVSPPIPAPAIRTFIRHLSDCGRKAISSKAHKTPRLVQN